MKEEWNYLTIKDLCSVDWGNTNLTKKSYVEKGDFLAVSAAGCDGRINHKEHEKFTPVLSAIGAQCGRMFYPQEDFTAIKNTITLTPKRDKVQNKFLYYLLIYATLPQRGAGQPFISKGDIEKFPVFIPQSLKEQKEIVSILDDAFVSIDKAKANIERNIENAEELFQSKLNEIFSQTGDGWNSRKLGDACVIIMGQSPKGTTYNKNGIGTPLINGPVEFGPTSFSTTLKTKWTTDPKKLCNPEDLILCVRGSTTGKINIAGFEACIGRGVAAIRYVRNQKWINYFFRVNQRNIYNLGTGSTFPSVSSKSISSIIFSEPILKEDQDVLIKQMDELNLYTSTILKNYKKQIFDLNELKKSILQKAFSGELTNKSVAA